MLLYCWIGYGACRDFESTQQREQCKWKGSTTGWLQTAHSKCSTRSRISRTCMCSREFVAQLQSAGKVYMVHAGCHLVLVATFV